jgi:hypothetical protein
MQDMALNQLLLVPTVLLREEAWARIAQVSGLPVEARSDIERAVSIYKMSDFGSSPAETRQSLADTERALRSVRSDLEKLAADPRAIAAIERSSYSKADMPAGTARAGLTETAKRIDRIADLISAGRMTIKAGRPGAREASLRVKILVKFLDDILFAFTRKHVSRSSNRKSAAEYITAVSEATELGIAPYSIDEAIKQITMTRRLIERGEIEPLPPA